jgi:gliding motility-associated-like protein
VLLYPTHQTELKMKRLLLLLCILCSGYSSATHVVGGEIIYQHVGGSSYILTLKLYRDCDPASVDFPLTTNITVDQGDGTPYTIYTLPRLGRDTLQGSLDTCAFDPGICVEEAIYSSVVSLPPGSGGYHMYYRICCRNGSILNINNPLNARETFYAYVPDNNIYLTNSSPVISNFPPVYVCNQQNLNLDFAATDADGDSLVYSFYTPYDGVNGTGISYTTGPPPNNFQAQAVNWIGAFNANNPLDNNAPIVGLNINTQTGFITGSPDGVGQFVVGVMVDEYRDDSLIGRITRDFQLNVVNCPPPQDAAIGPVDACNGLAITFDNQSGAGANGYWWDFGTANPADTSIVFEPTFTYTSIGSYTVTLMAQKGTLCADTVTYNMIISGLVADFTFPDTVCIGEDASFTDLSAPAANGVVDTWAWDFGDGGTSSIQNPTHNYAASGDQIVQLISYSDVGCSDTVTYTVYVKIPPQAGIIPLVGCNGLTVDFTNNSDALASGFWWDFGTGFPADTSIITDPTFTYGSYGNYTVTLVAQKGTSCADTATYNLNVSTIDVNFIAEDTTCTNVLVPFTDASFTSGGGVVDTWQWDFDGAGSSTSQNPNLGFTVAGTYNVQLIAQSDLGCIDSITIPIVIEDSPIAQIGPTDFCSGLTINFSNNSGAGASGFWWDFGTANPADTSILSNPVFTYPGFGPYTVTLIAQKGTACQTSTTINIQVSEITANFSSDLVICEGTIINFTDASITQVGTTITDWDWNFGDLNVSTQQNPSHVYNGTTGTIPVELIVTSNIGCQDTLVQNIDIVPLPIVNAGIDTAVCVSNPSLVLNGSISNGGTGFWTGLGGVFTPSNTTLNATYFPSLGELNNSSTYLVLTSNPTAYCAAVTDTIVIQYLATPTINAGIDIEVCLDTTYIQLDASLGFSTNTVWTTDGAGAFDDDSQLDATYTFSPGEIISGDSILFAIETFNFSGCPDDEDTVWLFFNAPPTIGTVFDDTVCAGFPIPLNSNSTTGNALWTTSGDGTFNPDSSASTIYTHGIADETTGDVTIYFETLDNGGCPALYDTLAIVIVPSPTPDYTFIEDCFGSPTMFTNSSSSVDPIVGYLWTFETGQTSTDTDPTHTFTAPGIHPVQLIVTSANGCQDTLTVDVNSHHIPVADFAIPAPCLEPASYYFDSSFVVNDSIVSWNWDFGDASAASTDQNPGHNYNGAGTYDVTLNVSSGFGCSNSVTMAVTIYSGPNAAFTLTPASGNVGADIYVTDNSTGDPQPIISWVYDFGDNTFLNAPDGVHQFDPEGEYPVSLIVIDDVGCSDTVTIIVPIYHGPLVPSAFTPNGDGNNDFLNILGGNFESVDFKVYNNWGEVIYETLDPFDTGWDGTYKNVDQPIGVYVYVAAVTTYDGEEHILKGDVSLIR